MKKLISLAVALAMIISVMPMFGLTAAAAAEEKVLFDAATTINEGEYHGDIDLTKYGWTADADGVKFSTQWSESGAWNTAPWGEPALMFFRANIPAAGTDETKSATIDNAAVTAGATRIAIEFKFAMQTDNDNYQYWSFKDLDGKTFAQLHYDKNGPCDAGITKPVEYATGAAAASALCGTTMKIEAVKGETDWTVTYTSGSKVVCTEKIDSINGFKSIQAIVKEWSKQYKAMGLMGLKITADIDTDNIAEITVKTVLSDGTDSGIEDITVLALAGQEYTYTPKSTEPIKVGDTYYLFDEEKSKLTITPTVGGDNVIELYYEKFDGAGITGSVIADGATCWFADPRTLTVKSEDGDVNYTYIGYIDNNGNVKATQYDNKKGEYEEVLVRSNLQPDDHNNPAFLELPDHHIMIIYSRHTDEPCFYYRVSKQPYDITTLGEEKRLATANNTTYPNPFILSDDPDHIYMGWRGINWHPTLAQLEMPTAENNYTTKFTWGPKQVVQSTGARPYAKYSSNGKDEIWVTYTTGHPDNEDPNWLYFNKINIKNYDILDVKGNVVGNVDNNMLKVNKTDSSKAIAVDTPSAGTRDWVWEVVNDNGYPVIAMVKISSDKKKHDYWYARYDGSEWKFIDLPDPDFNTFFHETASTENCYSGGMSIDKANPHVIYASVPVDGVFGRVFEIVKYTVSDDYTTVTTEAVTENSLKDNARPYVANGSEEGDLRLTWFNGDYYYWIHSNQFGGKGFPVQMMTTTEMAPMPTENTLDPGTGEVKSLLTANELAAAPTGDSFTISVNLLQSEMDDEGTLLESGDLKVELKKQTVDDTHDYAAVAPQITVGDTVEKSQNLFSDSAWYFSLSGTEGRKGQSPLGWINYTLTYDGNELVTYVNGLIDATIQGAKVNLGDAINAPGGLLAVAADVRTADVALTQAEVRAAMAEFDEDGAQTKADEIFDNFDADALEIPTEAITDLILPTKTNSGSAITWTSSAPEVITNDGAVVRDSEAHEVVLTAAFGDRTKEFTVSVPAKVNVMEENIILSYNFNDVTDNVVPDVSGNGNDAEVKGTTAKFDNGKLDLTANVLNTKGGTDAGADNGYLNVPHDILKDVRSYTVIQQIEGGTGSDPRLYDFGSSGNNSVFTRLNTRNANQYQAGIKYNGQSTLMVAGGTILSGEYWLITSYSAVTKETKIYTMDAEGLKTVASGTNVTYEPYMVAGSVDRNYIGRSQWNSDQNNRQDNVDFNGTIDNFMFFNTALTEDEIKEVTAAKVSATPALRITKNEDGTVAFGLAFTATVTGNLDSVSEVGFTYSVNAKADDGTYTKVGEPTTVKLDKVTDTFRLTISGISNNNSARTYTAQPYIVVNGNKVYGETVKANLYDVLIDSIINAKGTTIPAARLAAANSVISFVKNNRKADSEAKFPGLKEATDKLYPDGKMLQKAVDLGILDDVTVQLAETLSLESVQLEFIDTDVTESEIVDDLTADLDFVPEL